MRPRFHFTSASGWINDPHGITARGGVYDVFFQHVPGRIEWAPDCHWGHARGADLLTLREAPIAIAPGDGDDGIWTGSIVEDGGDVVAFYTAVSTPDFGVGRVRVARPRDASWTSWTKGAVVAEAPPELDLLAFRDPFVRREGDHWRMFVGAAGRDGTAMALTYTSPDLRAWSYDGVALERPTSERDPVWMGALWECPQVFELGGRSVMVSSVWDADVLHYAGYATGAFADGRFAPDTWARLTWGESLYAPSLFIDAEGEPALVFWLRGISGEGWTGAHSIPYRLSLVDGRVVARPHPDVAAHRGAARHDGVVDGLAADIEWTDAEGTLAVTSGPETVVMIEVSAGEALVTTPTGATTLPVSRAVRVVVDGPVVEVSSDAGLFAAAIAPAGDELRASVNGGNLVVHGLV